MTNVFVKAARSLIKLLINIVLFVIVVTEGRVSRVNIPQRHLISLHHSQFAWLLLSGGLGAGLNQESHERKMKDLI